ncbi:MAG: hypothetical protein R3Y47_02140 [Lachnospiraceae bacterium]
MINSIIEAISTTIGEVFPNNEIYMEEIKQGLNEPCFFISCLKPTHDKFLGNRYFTSNNFCIQYFPSDANAKQRECNEVASKLNDCLEYIKHGEDIIGGSKMSNTTVDGVLNYFVSYDLFVIKTEDTTPMESIDSQINVEEGE